MSFQADILFNTRVDNQTSIGFLFANPFKFTSKFLYMAGQFITIHVGQCGNSIGMEFWKNLCEEHGISKDGSLLQPDSCKDVKDAFFYQAIYYG